MISHLHGTVTALAPHQIIIEVAGFGLAVFVADEHAFSVGSQLVLTTSMIWNTETGPQLFGFSSSDERAVFDLIIACPGIGPKTALSALATFSPADFIAALTNRDVQGLSRIDGIGKKKAESMIVLLKDKAEKLLSSGSLQAKAPASLGKKLSDTLTALGYNRFEIDAALAAHQAELGVKEADFDALLRKCLLFMAMKKA
jgi:Holliday junction DNA helicase RuvA